MQPSRPPRPSFDRPTPAFSRETERLAQEGEGAELLALDPNALTQEIIGRGEAWSDLDAAASILEETKKTLLAEITVEYIRRGTITDSDGKTRSITKGEAELLALSDPRYKKHLQDMVDARKQANRARVSYDLGRTNLDLIRSRIATLRAELGVTRYAR